MITCLGRAQEQKPPEKHEWDYGKQHGPQHWGDLKPEFAPCKVGHRQSPIDIQKTEKADLPVLQFDYKPSPLRIVDNGHTIMVTYAAGSFLRVGGARYQLKQFHFHRPSEERIHGKTHDMVLHLVHADDRASAGAASDPEARLIRARAFFSWTPMFRVRLRLSCNGRNMTQSMCATSVWAAPPTT